MDAVTAFAPATVSNVACGFDVLGFALDSPGDLVTARSSGGADRSVVIESITGDGGRLSRDPAKNTAGVAAKAVLDVVGATHGVVLNITKGLPLASGLGGSAASAVAAVVAVDALLGTRLSIRTLMTCALRGEALGAGSSHPDNAAPGLYGGLVLVRAVNPPDVIQLPVPDGLTVVVVHPHIEIETAKARALIGEHVPLASAIREWANLGAFVHGLHTGDFDLISRSLEDSIAEPRRAQLIPGLSAIKSAARHAGALGASLSGSGPSIFALCRGLDVAQRAAAEMTTTVRRNIPGPPPDVYIAAISPRGARIVDAAESLGSSPQV